jgi:excisionase family DNA binding protein
MDPVLDVEIRVVSDEALLSVAAAAELAKVSGKTISQWIKSGLLPTLPVGKHKLIRKSVLQQLMRDRYNSPNRRLPRNTLTNL